MVYHRKMSVMAFLLLAFWPVSALRSGEIDPAFHAKIEGLGGREMVKAMVMMAEKVDLDALNSELIASQATRQVRHERVVRALQEMTLRTQPDVRRSLEEARSRGEVQRFHPYWVSNVIGVTATVDFIYRLSQRPDVGVIYEDRVIPLDKTFRLSEEGEAPPIVPMDVEPGVTSMRADSLWRAGITGDGVLVCNLDTGVNGNHPALADRWRGNDPGVTPQEAWFDPYNNSIFPVDDGNHGTGTMGCMTGVDPVSGDTIGVAPGAKWIAANCFEDAITTSGAFTAAFEWTIDPDGNPATISDVPDIINNSWGSGPGCTDGDWSSIDANIAAGVMVVFSAGNDGPGAMTVSTPASRITTSTNAFAVGATNASNSIASFSSRGPSPCDGVTIKPEVVAHGSNIRTASQSGGYMIASGTSFSGPYAAGALALLRDISPDATPDQLMEILMSTAVDLGPAGEDNSYGHGIPDLVEAANAVLALERNPRITFSGSVWNDGGNGEPEAGESFDLVVHLGNMGISTTDVEATLSLQGPDPLVTIDSDFSSFGDIGPDTTGNNLSNPYHVTLDPEMPGAHLMNFVLDVTADGGAYAEQVPFTLSTPFVITMADHDIGNVRFSVSDGGRFGWDSLDQTDGSGFVFPISDVDQLYEGALVAGYDSVHVSHSARSTPSGPVATDWQLLPGGDIQITTPGIVSDQDGSSRYADSGADDPMGIEVSQRSLAWSDSTYHDFVIVELTLHNTGIDSSSDIENLYAGMYMDWDVRPWTGQLPLNDAGVDTTYDVGYIRSRISEKHCGVSVLTEAGLASFDLIDNQASQYEFTRAEYWGSLSGGIADYSGLNKDWSFLISTGPFNLPAGDSVTVAFAVLGGESLDDLLSNVNAAREIYGAPVGVGGDVAGGGNLLPRAFALAQNYPNPFNPSTTIRYQIPENAHDGAPVSLEVFDLRGRKVRTLVGEDQAPGYYAVQWNGRGDHGERLASGIYLYRLSAGTFQETRRMLLVK